MDEDAIKRVQARMAKVDAMPPPLRALVHDHGLTIIQAFLDHGITRPRTIRHIIQVVQRGSYEIGDRTDRPRIERNNREDR